MRRRHLIEIIDQPWCPPVIRDGVTDYLQFIAGAAGLYRRLVPRLGRVLDHLGTTEIVDLGSGAGGPWPTLRPLVEEALSRPLEVTLTDLHPNTLAAATHGFRVYHEPVDARHVPVELAGFRTLCAVLHHFQPDTAREILADAVERRCGIAVIEMTRRSLLAMVIMLMTPFMAAISAPFIRPFSLSRLLFTYIIPVIPLVTAFDGVVSCLRTYTPEELLELVRGLGGDDYRWEVGTERTFPPSLIPATYLIGYPVDPSS